MIDEHEPAPWNPTGDLDGDAEDGAREAWRIHSDREATWAIKKMRAAQAELDRVKEEYDAERELLDQFLKDASAGPERDLEFFKGHLIAYRMELEDRDPDLAKTYKLPGGNLTRRAGSKVIEVTDLDEFRKWALTGQRYALLSVGPAKQAIKDLLRAVHGTLENGDDDPIGLLIDQETGEAAQGVVELVKPDSYDVRLT